MFLIAFLEGALSIIPYQYFNAVFPKNIARSTLITMIEKARKILDKGGAFDALLTDLPKVFDCMIHDLLLAKLHAVNIEMNARDI